MQVRDIMTKRVAFCTPDSDIRDVAAMMVNSDCGAIPVVDPETHKAIGVVTDRDIVCRTVAKEQNPLEMKADQIMTFPISSIALDASLERCLEEMESARIRRMLVIDQMGVLCGIVSQADIARAAPENETAELIKDLSKPDGGVKKIPVQ